MNKEGFARLQTAALKNVVPDRHECFGNGCGSNHAYSGRNEERVGFLRGAILRVAAAGYERHDFVADLEPSHILADRDDFAGNLEDENIAGSARRRIRAAALYNFSAVYSRRRDLDQKFV